MVCLKKLSPLSLDSIARVVEVFASRMNAIPYPETSDTARKEIIVQLKFLLTDYKDAFKSCMGNMLDMLSKALLDSYPDVKIETSELVCQFCKAMPDHIALNAKSLVSSLVANVKHRLKTVRKAAIVVDIR